MYPFISACNSRHEMCLETMEIDWGEICLVDCNSNKKVKMNREIKGKTNKKKGGNK